MSRILFNSINWSSVFVAVSQQMKVVEKKCTFSCAPENASGSVADGDSQAEKQGLFKIG